jgi:hypothetical protein
MINERNVRLLEGKIMNTYLGGIRDIKRNRKVVQNGKKYGFEIDRKDPIRRVEAALRQSFEQTRGSRTPIAQPIKNAIRESKYNANKAI